MIQLGVGAFLSLFVVGMIVLGRAEGERSIKLLLIGAFMWMLLGLLLALWVIDLLTVEQW